MTKVAIVFCLVLLVVGGCQLLSPDADTEQTPVAAPVQEAEGGLVNIPVQTTEANPRDEKQVLEGAGLLNQFRFEILSGSGGLLLGLAVIVLALRGQTYKKDLVRVADEIRKHPDRALLAAIGRSHRRRRSAQV